MSRLPARAAALCIGLVIICGVGGWQGVRLIDLKRQQADLRQQVTDLQKIAIENQARTVMPVPLGQQYCDSYKVCFEYPSNWTVTKDMASAGPYEIDSISGNNAANTVSFNYLDPLIKDGGSDSYHVVSIDHVTVGGKNIAVLGLISVSSLVYNASYILLPADTTQLVTKGADTSLINGSINPRFSLGMNDDVSFTAYPSKPFAAFKQAQAWFSSSDAHTALSILKSVHVKQ